MDIEILVNYVELHPERNTLIYVKIAVKNDGRLKIGLAGEVVL